MNELAQLRLFFAKHIIAGDVHSALTGVAKSIIDDFYIPQVKKALKGSSDSNKSGIEKQLSDWSKVSDLLKNKKTKWANFPYSKIKETLENNGIYNNPTAVEDCIADFVSDLYIGTGSKKLRDSINPVKDSPDKLLSFFINRAKWYAKDWFGKQRKYNKKFIDPDVRNYGQEQDEEAGDIFDGIMGTQEVSRTEISETIKGLSRHVLNKIKSDAFLVGLWHTWFKAFRRQGDIGSINFKSDVYRHFMDKFADQYDVKYPAVLKRFRESIVPHMADFFVKELGGNKNYYKRTILRKQGSDGSNMVDRIASEFRMREIMSWVISPALKIQQLMKK